MWWEMKLLFFKSMLDSKIYIKVISDIVEQSKLHEVFRIFVIVQEHVKQEEAPG